MEIFHQLKMIGLLHSWTQHWEHFVFTVVCFLLSVLVENTYSTMSLAIQCLGVAAGTARVLWSSLA